MEKKLEGVFTALVTPFKEGGSIDWPTLQNLVELQIEAGVDGLVPCGTTGEAPTLAPYEHSEVIEKVVQWTAGRAMVIAGTGSNSTAETVSMSRHAAEIGVDGCLVVNPYYNKPTQEGLYRHFRSVAEAVEVPVVVYNIRGRTGVNVETRTLLKLVRDCSNIRAVKEASGDLAQISEVIRETPAEFSVLSGDDNLTLKVIELGGHGVISVASNLLPQQIVELVRAGLSGSLDRAAALNESLSNLFEGMFIETNPIPIKAALARKGLCGEHYRLPLCELAKENRRKLEEILSQY